MTHATITLRQIETSVGAVFPRAVLEELHVGTGDTLHLVRTDRGFILTAFDPDFDVAAAIYRDVARQYRNALRDLSR